MRKNPIAKGLQSSSLRDSINAHCYMCMGGELKDETAKGNIVKAIRECDSKICPINNVRPYQ